MAIVNARHVRERAHAATALLVHHVRVAGTDPRRLWWLARRVLSIVAQGRFLSAVDRHRLEGELFGDYAQWAKRHAALEPEALAAMQAHVARGVLGAMFTIIMPTYNTPARWLRECVASVVAQVYPSWRLFIADDGSTSAETLDALASLPALDARIHVRLGAHGGIAATSNAALAHARATLGDADDYVVLLDHDDVVSQDALYQLAAAIACAPGVEMLYSDEDKIDVEGRVADPHFKPAWDAELIRTMNYAGHVVAIRRTLVSSVGNFSLGVDGAQDWDLVLRCAERAGDGAVRHVPSVLYHWRVHRDSTAAGLIAKPTVEAAQREVVVRTLARNAIDAAVERTRYGWRIRRRADRATRMSLIVPTQSRRDLVLPLVQRLRAIAEGRPLQMVIVDHRVPGNTGLDRDELEAGDLDVRIVPQAGDFNFARFCNEAVRASDGDIVLLLNDDVMPADAEFLDELAAQGAREEVGAVGGLLFYPDGRIQHAGIVLNVNGAATHIWRGYHRDWGGIHGRARLVQQASAVTGACLATRRAVWDALGGMDESFARSFNDVDYCLRAGARGLMVLFTPFATATHLESATRGLGNSPDEQRVASDDAARFASRWPLGETIDRAYHPALASRGTPFTLSEDRCARVDSDAPFACRAR